MRIKDAAAWHGLKAANSEGPDSGAIAAMLKFVEIWCDRAELVLDRNGGHTLLEALRETLESTEELLGTLPPNWTAQALLIIINCWEGGESLGEEMTIFEKKLVEDMRFLVNQQAQETAASGG